MGVGSPVSGVFIRKFTMVSTVTGDENITSNHLNYNLPKQVHTILFTTWPFERSGVTWLAVLRNILLLTSFHQVATCSEN